MLITTGDPGEVLIIVGDLGNVLNSGLQQIKILPLINCPLLEMSR